MINFVMKTVINHSEVLVNSVLLSSCYNLLNVPGS